MEIHYVSLRGNWLRSALLRQKDPKEATGRYLDRCSRMLEREAHIDRALIKDVLYTGGPVEVPLFFVALAAQWIGCTVERLLWGTDDPEFDDPHLETTEGERAAVRSANSFGKFLREREVLFPTVLWDYAFPTQRRGEVGEITLEQWSELYRERYKASPRPR